MYSQPGCLIISTPSILLINMAFVSSDISILYSFSKDNKQVIRFVVFGKRCIQFVL